MVWDLFSLATNEHTVELATEFSKYANPGTTRSPSSSGRLRSTISFVRPSYIAPIVGPWVSSSASSFARSASANVFRNSAAVLITSRTLSKSSSVSTKAPICWVGQGVAPDDLEVLHAVQEQIHAGDGRGDEIALLPVELERAVFAAGALHFVNAEISMPPVPQVGS